MNKETIKSRIRLLEEKRKELDLEISKLKLKLFYSDDSEIIDDIFQAIQKTFSIPKDTIKSGLRNNEIVNARFAAQFLLKNNTDLSLKEIGNHTGVSDHSSVIYGIHTAGIKIKKDKIFREAIANCNDLLSPDEQNL